MMDRPEEPELFEAQSDVTWNIRHPELDLPTELYLFCYLALTFFISSWINLTNQPHPPTLSIRSPRFIILTYSRLTDRKAQ